MSRPQAKSLLTRPPTQGGEAEFATSRPRPRDGSRDQEGTIANPISRGQWHDVETTTNTEIEAKGLAVRDAPSRPQVRQVNSRTRSQATEVKTAGGGNPTPRVRSHDQENMPKS